MAERLPELRPLKGRIRVLQFHGNDGLGRSPYRTFLADYYVTSDPVDLAEEGRGHAGHEHLTFSNCVANTGDGPLVLEMTRTSRNRAKVAQLINGDAKPRRPPLAPARLGEFLGSRHRVIADTYDRTEC